MAVPARKASVVELVGGLSVIDGATPPSLMILLVLFG